MAVAAEKMQVVVAGASGETGQSIMDALLSSPDRFQVTVLGRADSISKAIYKDFIKRGASVHGVDFEDIPTLASLLQGATTVIACITLEHKTVQEALIEASSQAGVGRFIPSFFATVCPPRGVMPMRAMKEDSLDKCKAIYLPYTVIDVGWWYQFSLPRVPSGKLDSSISFPEEYIAGDGNTRTALTDKADIGKFVARIISDPRTLNRQVFAYGEVTTQNQVFQLVEKWSGEAIPRKYMSKEEIEGVIEKADADIAANPTNPAPYVIKGLMEYKWSRSIRGDNTPEHANYLGYLNARELYPDFQPKSMDEFVREVVKGGASAALYTDREHHALKDTPDVKI
ncbi:hypothetical protein B0I35DRAFT_364420 [Stachybotrys elegans]|uniref:NmrA-like domain-containing protein n=1 Tax=Stachybotrys elegans TaxID=80388 RepID=A0A8K0WJB3_9HYPO|nr:hypothetical protein B0I35DRAFT_455239 [Stachybotrys elegans]KAH7303784.1 hypothetical protein B0I35DRAFT_364420 [Stachybotrys elegans]